MWPNVAVSNFVKIWLEGTLCGQQIRTTFAYQLDDISGGAEPVNDVMDAFFTDAQWTALQTAFLDCVPSNYTLDHVTWQWFANPAVFAQIKRQVGDPGTDLVATIANTQATIVRRPIAALREGVGAIRVPFAALDANVVDGELTAGYKAKLDALAALMPDPIVCTTVGPVTYTFEPVVLQKNPTWWTAHEVFIAFAQPTSRILRRRTARQGI